MNGNGYKRIMAGLAVLGFISGIFVDRLFVERREAALESRISAVEQLSNERRVAVADSQARIESRLRSIEASQMEVAVQLAEINTRLSEMERRRRP